MITLAVKYRPRKFEDVCGQTNVITILENQIKEGTFKNVYLFCGPSGCGKTTLARIFANKLNDNGGSIIELDAASNNGVDDVRRIIDDSKFSPIDGSYKIYIIDECHQFSTGAWNAMLKLIEEPPQRTIFMFCTTDPQKIPNTILSRVQRYDFTRISSKGIVSRLKYILEQEHILNYEEDALQLIAKINRGGMRDSISTMEKCLGYNGTLTVNSVVEALGIVGYDSMICLLDDLVNNKFTEISKKLDTLYNNGIDLKLFVFNFIQFILDYIKYNITKDIDSTGIPQGYIKDIEQLKFNKERLLDLLNDLIKLYSSIKYESNPFVFIQAFFVRETL